MRTVLSLKLISRVQDPGDISKVNNDGDFVQVRVDEQVSVLHSS